MKKIIYYFLVALISIASCKKTDVQPPLNNIPGTTTGAALSEPGYGPSTAAFRGTKWSLPANVTLEDSIHEYSVCWAFAPFRQVQQKDWKGVPVGFPMCMTLHNSSTTPVIIQFPPELVLQSSSLLYQGILVIQAGEVEIAANSSKTVVMQGFCLNVGRHPPQTFVEETETFLTYSFGPSELPALLKVVTNILEPKHLTAQDVLDASGNVDPGKIQRFVPIQNAIWEVTDGEGLTSATRDKLINL